MPREGVEPTIPVFERAKTFHALDRAATVMDSSPPWFRNTDFWYYLAL
jgi:hypothetical protein